MKFVLNIGSFIVSIYFPNANNTFYGNRFKFYYIIYTNHFERPDIKATICKINNFFPFLPVSVLNPIEHK